MRCLISFFVICTALVSLPTGSGMLGGAAHAQIKASPAELEFWRSIRDSKDPSEFRAYLDVFPNGVFAPIARIRLKRLKAATAAPGSGGISAKPAPNTAKGGKPSPGTPRKGGMTASSSEDSGAGSKKSRPAKPRDSKEKQAQPKVIPETTKPKKEGPKAAKRDGKSDGKGTGIAGDFGAVGARLTWFDSDKADAAGYGKISGARVDEVLASYPARNSELKAGDFVVRVDGQSFTHLVSLINHIRKMPNGSTTRLDVIRGGKTLKIDVAVGRMLGSPLEAARKGDGAAMVKVAEIYFAGVVGREDLEEGRKWLAKALETKVAAAYFLFGMNLERGQFGYDVSAVRALKNYELAAEKGHAGAMFAAGRMLANGLAGSKDLNKARSYYVKAAAAGFVKAHLALAEFLEKGIGGPTDVAGAVTHFEAAEKAGATEAVYKLAQHYISRTGPGKDCAKGAALFKRALATHEAAAAWGLGRLHLEGCGVVRDREKAIAYFRQAAALDHEPALEQLSGMGLTAFSPKEIQELLDALGYKVGVVDGRVGERTRRAIRKFEADNGYEVTGELSLQLVKRLRKIMAERKGKKTAGAHPPPQLWKPSLSPERTNEGGREESSSGREIPTLRRGDRDRTLDGLMGD